MRLIQLVLKIRPVTARIRIVNALLRADIFYMQDLTLRTKRELVRLPEIGRLAVQRIEQALWVQKKHLRAEELVITKSTGLPDRRYGSSRRSPAD